MMLKIKQKKKKSYQWYFCSNETSVKHFVLKYRLTYLCGRKKENLNVTKYFAVTQENNPNWRDFSKAKNNSDQNQT